MFSLMAPRQPRKPVTMTMVPMAMTRLAADSEGKLGEKVAKLPWDTESQMPTPSSPQPQSWRERKQLDQHCSYFIHLPEPPSPPCKERERESPTPDSEIQNDYKKLGTVTDPKPMTRTLATARLSLPSRKWDEAAS